MRDVAGTAGVSVKTVSRVVNGESGVRAATAARVDAAIGRLGFTRNDLASSLRSGRAGALGLVIEDVANPFYSAIARAVEDAAHARGHILITGSCEEDPTRERQLALRLLRRLVDALLIVPAGAEHRYLLPELAADVPIVFLDRPPRGRGGGHRAAGQPRRHARGSRAPAPPGARAHRVRRRLARPLHRRRSAWPAIAPRSPTRGRDARDELVRTGLARRRARRASSCARCSSCPAGGAPPRCSRRTTATPSVRCARCATRRARSRSSASTTSSSPTCSPPPSPSSAMRPRRWEGSPPSSRTRRLDDGARPPQRRTIDLELVIRGSGEVAP